MANSELYNKQFKVPSNVLKGIQTTLISNPSGEGVKRAKTLLKNGSVTYQSMKRLKNFFDTFNPQSDNKIQYNLAGGELMKSFIDTTLDAERNAVKIGKDVRRDMNNVSNSDMMPNQTPRLNEDKKDLTKNVVAVIVNNDNKILLLKRSDYPKQWMPSKWGLVGGAIEKGEKPDEACSREIKEETGLDIDKFIKSFTIQRHGESEETIFACRYSGELTDIKLNEENSNYGWYDVSEMEFLDTVPHLIEYITLVFKKYD